MGATKLKPAHKKLDLVAAAAPPVVPGSSSMRVTSPQVKRPSLRIPPMPASVPVGMRREYRDLMRQLLESTTWNAQQLLLVECYLLAMHAARNGDSDALRLRARAQVLAYAQALGVATRQPQLLRGVPVAPAPAAPTDEKAAPVARWS